MISTADGANRGSAVAVGRPDLVAAVVALGTAPFARMHFEGSEGMIASDTVVGAFIKMLERDYRGALRTLLAATNAQMSEDGAARARRLPDLLLPPGARGGAGARLGGGRPDGGGAGDRGPPLDPHRPGRRRALAAAGRTSAAA